MIKTMTKIQILGVILLLLVIISAAVLAELENLRFFDAFYFSVITASTTGYGDFVPLTDEGKIFTMISGAFSWFLFFTEIHLLSIWVDSL